MTNTRFDEILEIKRQYEAKIEAEGQAILKEEFKTLFDLHPDVQGVYWKQYTPYFNDGDECIFGVCDPYFKISGVMEDYQEWDDGNEDEEWNSVGYVDTYSLGKTETYDRELKKWVPTGEPAKYDRVGELKDFSHIFTVHDVFKAVFGDHVQVWATRDGFHVEEYYHD